MQPLVVRPFALGRNITLAGYALDKLIRTTDAPRTTSSYRHWPLFRTVLRAILDTLPGVQSMYDDVRIPLELGHSNVV